MFAGNHSGSAAAGEGFLNSIRVRYNIVAFEKLNRQKWNLLQRFNGVSFYFQKITKLLIHQVVFVLVTKDF
jgi:hypothetical protein